MLAKALICFIGFLGLLAGTQAGWAEPLDQAALNTTAFSGFAAFHFLGSEWLLGGGALLLIAFLAFKRNMYGVLAVLAAVGGGNMLNKALKEWVGRERPPFPHGESGFSFVSGHAMLGIIFYCLLAYFLCSYGKGSRFFYAAALMLAFLSGISRIAEKAHYATDVLAGWLLGGTVFLLLVFLLKRKKQQVFYSQQV